MSAPLEARWEDSLHDRAAIAPRSPVPLLDELLAPLRATAQSSASQAAPGETSRHQPSPGDREKMISQIPPSRPGRPARPTLAIRGEPELTASDLARYLKTGSGAKGTRTPDPLLANNRHAVHPRPYPQVTVPRRASRSMQIPVCCCTFLLYSPPWSSAAQTPCGTPLRGKPRQAHGGNRAGSWDCHGSYRARGSPPLNFPLLPMSERP